MTTGFWACKCGYTVVRGNPCPKCAATPPEMPTLPERTGDVRFMIKSCDVENADERHKMSVEIEDFLEKHPDATLQWLQTSAATNSYSSHRLTAIITTVRGAP